MLISKQQHRHNQICWGSSFLMLILVGLVVALNLGLFSKPADAESIKNDIEDTLGETTDRKEKNTSNYVRTVRDVYTEDDALYIELNGSSDNSFNIIHGMEFEIIRIMGVIHDDIKGYDSVRFSYYYPLIDDDNEETVKMIFQVRINKKKFNANWNGYGNSISPGELKEYTTYYKIHDDLKYYLSL